MFDGLAPNLGFAAENASALADLVKWLNTVVGQTTIAIGAATVNVDVDPELHGRPLLATLNGVLATGAADATATSITSVRWSASVTGRFSINVNANATAVVGVSYFVGAPQG
jgi:hypothetical protein